MKKIIFFILMFIFIIGCGNSTQTNSSVTEEVNYTSFDGNISSLMPPPLPENS